MGKNDDLGCIFFLFVFVLPIAIVIMLSSKYNKELNSLRYDFINSYEEVIKLSENLENVDDYIEAFPEYIRYWGK